MICPPSSAVARKSWETAMTVAWEREAVGPKANWERADSKAEAAGLKPLGGLVAATGRFSIDVTLWPSSR